MNVSAEKLDLDRQPVALVTGSGAARIGQCVARALAGRGYRLLLHAHRSHRQAEALAAEIGAAGTPAVALVADFADETAVEKMVDDAIGHFGQIDALVNCAAVWERKRLEDVAADDVRRHFEINTLATYLCCQKVGLAMVGQQTGGAIVNLGDWAIERPYLDFSAYFPSKGAIPALTRTFAVELAERNPRVRVNAVLPGPVMLPEDMPTAERAAVIAQTLVRREGSPQNVADAVMFLIENDYVTGVCLPVDGGRTVFAGDTNR